LTVYRGQDRISRHAQQHAIEFFFIAEVTSLWGFHWLIEWSTSSFYVKCLHPAVGEGQSLRPGPEAPWEAAPSVRLRQARHRPGSRESGGRWSSQWMSCRISSPVDRSRSGCRILGYLSLAECTTIADLCGVGVGGIAAELKRAPSTMPRDPFAAYRWSWPLPARHRAAIELRAAIPGVKAATGGA
jgi:hypothetical protein